MPEVFEPQDKRPEQEKISPLIERVKNYLSWQARREESIKTGKKADIKEGDKDMSFLGEVVSNYIQDRILLEKLKDPTAMGDIENMTKELTDKIKVEEPNIPPDVVIEVNLAMLERRIRIGQKGN